MERAWNVFEAMSCVDSALIINADKALLGAGAAARAVRVRKARRAAFIAAIIAALLTATAAAAAWFGLETRYIKPVEAEAEELGDFAVWTNSDWAYLCLSGTVDSPEYAAQSEWLTWRAEFLAGKETDEAWKSEYFSNPTPAWTAEYGDAWNGMPGIYGAYSPEMCDALLDIARRNGVAVHTSREFTQTRVELEARTGAAEVLPQGDGVEYAYVYEDGSFYAGAVSGAPQECAPSFGTYYVYMGRTGVMPEFSYRVKPEEYERREEWTHTAPDGDELYMALLPTVLPEGMKKSSLNVEQSTLFILCVGDGAFVNVQAQVESVGARVRAEAFADSFDWAALTAGK